MNDESPTENVDRSQERSWRERGASLVEYALLLALIAIVCVAALDVLGGTVSETIHNAGEELTIAGS